MSQASTIEQPSFSERIWTTIEKAPKGNARQRLKVLRATKQRQAYLRGLFADGWPGFLCWLNLACWTFDPRRDPKHLPFNTWPIQDKAGRELWEAIDGGRDILFDKSRDMGASWLAISAMLWWWLFMADTPLKAASRKEEYVDAAGNPDTLFWKIDYLVGHLPGWLKPRIERRKLHLENVDNGSVIDGESTNVNMGRGGRRKAILLDEFAAVEDGRAILAATADATPCRIFNSTPQGRGNAFAEVRFSGKVQVLTLHWKDHPAKGAGVHQVERDGKQVWTSPWYEAECARRTSLKEIAQEIDIDYLASGETFFDLDVLQRMRVGDVLRPPDIRGEVSYEIKTVDEGRAYKVHTLSWSPDGGRRRLSLWNPPDCLLMAGDRPRQDRHYVAFADISLGMGASNSVLKIAEVNTRHVVGQWLCPDTSPTDFAEYCAAVCLWFGGKAHMPLMGWEANGPGGIFGRRLYALGYPLVLGNPNLSIPWEPEDNKIGWTSGKDSKADLLGELRAAWARGELIEHDEATIAEAESYIYYPTGAPGPSRLVKEPQGARAAHGDRVIADAGLLLCLAEQPRVKPEPVEVPETSYLGRRQAWQRQQRNENEW